MFSVIFRRLGGSRFGLHGCEARSDRSVYRGRYATRQVVGHQVSRANGSLDCGTEGQKDKQGSPSSRPGNVQQGDPSLLFGPFCWCQVPAPTHSTLCYSVGLLFRKLHHTRFCSACDAEDHSDYKDVTLTRTLSPAGQIHSRPSRCCSRAAGLLVPAATCPTVPVCAPPLP